MGEGYSRAMKSTSGKKNKDNESFRELKKMVDAGYERFWSEPHRIKMRPQSPAFGFIETRDYSIINEDEDSEFNDLTQSVK